MSKTCLGVTQWDSCFSADILGLTSGMVTSKRTLAIAKEIGTMSQNLPAAWDSSVFIRSAPGKTVDSPFTDSRKSSLVSELTKIG